MGGAPLRHIKRKKEKRGTVPSIGLSHAADKTEVFDESTTRSSGSQREGNSPRFSSTDEGTKKSIIQTKRGKQRAICRVRGTRWRSTMRIGAC